MVFLTEAWSPYDVRTFLLRHSPRGAALCRQTCPCTSELIAWKGPRVHCGIMPRSWRCRPKALAVLWLLARQAGQVVSKATLLDTVWAETVVSEGTLTTCLSLLRHALGEDAQQPRYIATVHRVGYRFVAPVTQASIGNIKPLSCGIPASASPHPAVPRASGRLPNPAPGGWPCALLAARRPQAGGDTGPAWGWGQAGAATIGCGRPPQRAGRGATWGPWVLPLTPAP